jgi:hypothetical protein
VNRILPGLLLGTWVAGCVPAALAPAVPVAEFFPLESGRTYHYKINGRDEGATISTEEIGQGHGSWVLNFWSRRSERVSWALQQGPEGVTLRLLGMGHGAIPIEPPLVFLPATLSEGVSWTSSGTISEKAKQMASPKERIPDARFTLVGSRESTTLKLGEHSYLARSAELRISAKKDNVQAEAPVIRLWVAPAVGIVRVEQDFRAAGVAGPSQTWDLTEITKKP